ncbi:MAG: hypothetical protein V8S24_07920 [Gordonibacter pamelaeae]
MKEAVLEIVLGRKARWSRTSIENNGMMIERSEQLGFAAATNAGDILGCRAGMGRMSDEAMFRSRRNSKLDERRGANMNKETFDYVAERVDVVLADSEFSTQVTKDAARAWKDTVAADSSDAAIDAATNDLLDVLEGRPTTIDGVIAFLQGPAIEMLGEDAAASALAAQQQRKEAERSTAIPRHAPQPRRSSPSSTA